MKIKEKFSLDPMENVKMIRVTVGSCPKCGTTVRNSQYGRDDECPECGTWLEWGEETEDDF